MSGGGAHRTNEEPASGEKQPEGVANFNDHVWVKVTAQGEKIYNAFYEARYGNAYRREGADVPKLQRDTNGWSRFPMHQVLSIFGSHMNGQTDPVIEMTYRTTKPE